MDKKQLLHGIQWIRNNLIFEVAAINLLFDEEGSRALLNIDRKIFGLPWELKDGKDFLKNLTIVRQDSNQFDFLNTIPKKIALLELHEHLKSILSKEDYLKLKGLEWFRALYHLRNGIGHDKRFKFSRKNDGSLSPWSKSLLPVKYKPFRGGQTLEVLETSEGEIIKLSEYDVHSIIDEAYAHFLN